MRRRLGRLTGAWLAGLAVGVGMAALGGCELTTREPSPAMVPARVMSTPSSPPLVDAAVLASVVRAGVRQPDINQAVYEVDAFLVALVIEDLASGRPSLTLEPAVSGPGYRVRGVREGSVYAALGLLDDDLIEAINGVPLASPPTASLAEPAEPAQPAQPAQGDAGPVAIDIAGQALAALAASERGASLQVSRAGVSSTRVLRFIGGVAWSRVFATRTGAPMPASDELAVSAVIADPVFPDMPSAPAPGAADRGGGRAPGSAGGRPAASVGKPAASASAPIKPTSEGAITCGGDGVCSVARRDFDAAVADPARLLRQVQISEARGGYGLSGIHSGSQVSQLGFRNGDIVVSVNGTRLDDQFGLLGLYGSLGSTRTYTVVYQRGGALQRKTVRLRD